MKKIIIYVFLLFFIIGSFSIISFLNTYFSERVKVYIDNKAVVYAQNYIQEAIMENVIDEINISSLYVIKEDTNQQVESVLINTSQVNKILGLVNNSLEESFNNLESETIKLPFNSIFGETLFSKYGPDINLRVIPIGKYTCDVKSSATEYGINNSLFEIYIQVSLNIETIVPLQRGENEVICKIPIVMQVIHGEVPRYYYNTDKLVPDVYDNNL